VLPSLAAAIAEELRDLEARDRLRGCPALAGASRQAADLDGRPALVFCSNDYLGLASHPALADAVAAAARTTGFGAGASRLVSGDLPAHRALEDALARLVQLPAALYFPSGYQANIGLLVALAGRGDLVVSDAANHASLIDGCRLSRADVAVYPHRDAAAAEALLASAAGRHRRRLLVTESLFSMDGDRAPLPALADAARRHDAALIVDEAHALGVLGPAGAGLCRAAGVQPDALVGTLGKAFGAAGGFVAGSPALRTLVVNRARTFVFTTAPPPPLAAASLAGVTLAAGPEGERRRGVVRGHVERLRRALGLPPDEEAGPILPVVLGTDRAALEASAALRSAGLFVQAIRPPTVPEGTARLRVTLSAAHDDRSVDSLAEALGPFVRPPP
jgi:8-amino-7-oxononanoate synthase